MSNMFYLFFAYAIIWVVLFAYILGLTKRQEKLLSFLEEIELLKDKDIET